MRYAQAMETAKQFARELSAAYGETVAAVYVIGSLGGGYYRPGQSDIDTFVIIRARRDAVPALAAAIGSIAERYCREYDVPKGFGAVVASEEQLFPPYVPQEELVMEIVRLKAQSRLVYGDFNCDRVPMPDRQAILDAENEFEDWAMSEGKVPPESMTRPMIVNSILILLKRYLLLRCGIVEFNKLKVVGLYLAQDPPYIHEEFFRLIDESLASGPEVIDDKQLLEMSLWHEQLRQIMNRELLGRRE